MLKKEIEITMKRHVEWMELENGFVAFQDVRKIGDRIIETIEGIAKKEQIEVIDGLEEIEEKDVALLRKGIREELMQVGSNFYPFHVKEPFTFLKKNGLEEAELLRLDGSSNEFYEADGTIVPQAIHLTQMSALLTNWYYDLEKVLAELRKRNDVVFREEGIVSIPYYMQSDRDYEEDEERETDTIDVQWNPTVEQYAKIKEFPGDRIRQLQIAKEILGLETFRK